MDSSDDDSTTGSWIAPRGGYLEQPTPVRRGFWRRVLDRLRR